MSVFKIILSIGIVGICTYFGYSKSKKLKKRVSILKDTLVFFDIVKNEISYNLTILPNAYEVARQKIEAPLKDSIGQISVDMIQSDRYECVNQTIVNKISEIENLTYYDKNLIINTFKTLGKSDLNSQISVLENIKKNLEYQIKEAEENKNKNSKLYRTVGTVIGLMTVIVLI